MQIYFMVNKIVLTERTWLLVLFIQLLHIPAQWAFVFRPWQAAFQHSSVRYCWESLFSSSNNQHSYAIFLNFHVYFWLYYILFAFFYQVWVQNLVFVWYMLLQKKNEFKSKVIFCVNFFNILTPQRIAKNKMAERIPSPDKNQLTIRVKHKIIKHILCSSDLRIRICCSMLHKERCWLLQINAPAFDRR